MNIKEMLKENSQDFNKILQSNVPKILKELIEKDTKNDIKDYDIDACNYSITKPMWDLLERGGKRWRPFLMKNIYMALNGENNIDKFTIIPEIIHNGTLIIDDIEDNSDKRRGKDCIHKIYGNDIAINAGNMMYYITTLILTKDNSLTIEMKTKIYELINEEMIKLHLGQGMDIFWHNKNKIPKEKEYLQMCACKTGTLARMAAKFGAILAKASDKQISTLGEFAESLGIAFQIQDDILNIIPEENWGKDFGDDINEGKKTLIIIKAIEELERNDRNDLIGILELKTKNKTLITEAINIIKKTNAIKYSNDLAKEIVKNAWEKLDLILENSISKEKLKLLSDFVVNRKI